MGVTSKDFVVLGGGVAGLTMASVIAETGRSVAVIERGSEVGGLARTIRHDGFGFDLGGHRFHSNNPDVVRWLHDLVGPDLLRVNRRSRILLNGRFIDYPIRLGQATGAFGFGRGLRVAASYGVALARGRQNGDVTFEDWVVRRFGRGLFELYFRPYTEKVWGIPCDQIAADWAAHRIGVPSLSQAAFRALVPWATPPPTAVAEFYYPRQGYGVIADRLAKAITARGQEVLTDRTVTTVRVGRESAEVDVTGADGAVTHLECGQVISTIPVHHLLQALAHDAEVARAAATTSLSYRGLLVVFLALDRGPVSTDTWTYFPERSLLFGRCHEPRNWSPDLVPHPGVTSLALEVFCSAGDEVWTTPDETLVQQVVAQLAGLGWIRPGEVRSARVEREAHAYPVYALDYAQQLGAIRTVLQRWPRLSLLGRTGGFEYLNVDGIVESCFALANGLAIGRDVVRPLATESGRWI